MKLTKYKISLISLAMVFLIALSAFFGLQFMTAEASGTTSGENVFRKSGDNVKIVAVEKDVSSNSSSSGTAKNYYMTFLFNNGEEDEEDGTYVYYNNKLAYNWFETSPVEEDHPEAVGDHEAWFSMELGFVNTNFERYVITFESQQYLKTKDGKTANYVMFFPAGNNKVYIHVTQDKDDTVESENVDKSASFDADHIRISFFNRDSGTYSVAIENKNSSSVLPDGTLSGSYMSTAFENIGGSYAKNVTSGTTVYPLIFEADFKEDAEETTTAAMTLYNLNGQEMSATNGTINTDISTGSERYFTLNSINDNKPPVLCLENDFKFFTQGASVDFDYVVIDVLRTSASGKINYFILTNDLKKKGDEKDENGVSKFDYNDKDLFKEVGDHDIFETDHDAYLPTESDLKNTAFDPVYFANGEKNVNGKLCADMLVRVYVHIYDTSSTSVQETADVFLDRYLMHSNYTVMVNGEPFIAVAQDKLGATYNYGDSEKDWEDLLADYQEEVTKAAEGLSAGSSNYFYLPSPEKLFSDNGTAYTDMKISIYYYGSEQQNNSSLATSNLSINVTKQGPYTFTVYATDTAGNNMYYLEEVTDPNESYDFEKGGKRYKYVEFTSAEIWDIFADKDKKNKLPWFTFNVKYTGVEFEEKPGMQATGYVGTSYDSASFKINGVDYSTVYRLFYFKRDDYSKDNNGKSFSYEEFIANAKELFDNPSTRTYFKEIIALDSMEETDEEYKEFADYAWSNTSTSFTPQAAGYYYMIAEARDNDYEADPVEESLAIVVSEASKPLKGESDWLKNNLTSVILLSVAALALIGIILLLVIKPKNKEDIDVRFEEKKKNKKSK